MKITTIENERFFIRPAAADDKEAFMHLQQENSELSEAYKDEAFREHYWKGILEGEDDVYMLVFLKEDGRHIGNCSFQNVNSPAIEIGIDIDKRVQNQGFGTEVLTLLVAFLRANAPEQRCLIRTKSTNAPCRRMIEKAGGVKTGEEATDFDRIMDKMLPKMEKAGLTQEMGETGKLLDRSRGVCTYIYEFMK